MAFNIRKIDPIDLQPRRAVGVSLPFSGKAVFNSTFQTKDAIKTNLINYFLTNRGERYLNPDFGNQLQTLLFDNLTKDKVEQIDALIREDLRIFFPKVQPVEVKTVGDADSNTVQFEDEVVINFLT